MHRSEEYHYASGTSICVVDPYIYITSTRLVSTIVQLLDEHW